MSARVLLFDSPQPTPRRQKEKRQNGVYGSLGELADALPLARKVARLHALKPGSAAGIEKIVDALLGVAQRGGDGAA